MSNKSIDDIIKAISQVSNITITKAGESQSMNPAELVALTQILDNWKSIIIEENRKHASKLNRAVEQLEILKSKCNLSISEMADYNELLIDLRL